MAKVIKNKIGRNFKRARSADRLTAEKRSFLMSRIRSKNTKFESLFIDELKKTTKFKFNTHDKNLLGTPDIVFQRKKIAIFLDSNFWHGWFFPKWKHLLKDDFWRDKIEKNRMRDRRVTIKLRREGWVVIRIWEHQIKKDMESSISKILAVLNE